MTKSWTQLLALSLLAAGATAFSACGSDDGDSDAGTTPDAGNDTSNDTDPGLDIPDSDGGLCENPCARPADCGNGFTCVDGCCQSSGPGPLPPCTAPLAACQSDTQTTNNFVCNTEIGQCLQRCPSETTDDTRGRNCPTGSFCIELNGPGIEDPTTGRVLDGFCLPGDCNDVSLFDSTACEGTRSVLNPGSQCTSDTCTCQPIANGASFCFPAGEARLGDECGRSTGGNVPATDVCEAGLLCFQGFCAAPCNLRDGATACASGPAADRCPDSGDCTCNPVFDTTPRNQPGICAVSCTAFSTGECPSGQQCVPQFGRFGINDWFCTDNAQANLPGEGEECDGSAGNFGACQEGLLCTRETENGPFVCLGFCDPLLLGAGCGEEVIGETLFGPLSFEGASAFAPLASGSLTVSVRDAGTSAAIAPLAVTVTADEYTTYLAVADAAAGAGFQSFSHGGTDEEEGIRFFHGAADAGPVDIFLGAFLTGFEYTDEPITLNGEAEQVGARIFLAGEQILSAAPTLAANQVLTAWAWLDGAAPALGVASAASAPSPAAGDAAIRFLHAATSAPNVDIYANCDDVCTAAERIYTNVAYGSASSMEAWLTVPAGDIDLSVFVAGADPETDDAALEVSVTLEGGMTYLAIARTDGTDLSVALETESFDGDEGDAYVVLIHAAFGVAAVDILLEASAYVEGLAFGELSEDDESLYFETLGDVPFNVAIRAAGAGLEAAPVLESGMLDPLDGPTTVIVAGLAGDDSLTWFAVEDTYPTLAAGQGAVRVIHAAPAVGAVTVNALGASSSVCTPSAISGFGLCAEGCTPYPRTGGGEYGCDDSSASCLPFIPRSDRPVTPLGACQADTGTVAAGGTCGTPGRLGGDCQDFAVCLSDTQAATTGTCLPLCEPFGEGCGEFGTCSGVPPLLGQLNFSFCLADAQPGNPYDRCEEVGLPCAADGTLCFPPTQNGPAECMPVCRQGFTDCAGFNGRTCRTGFLNPDVVPGFMGLCL